MPRTSKKPPVAKPPVANGPTGEVLTLSEAAAYLRVSEEAVLQMIRTQGLPARQFDAEWRFSREGLQQWLRCPPLSRKTAFWETHFGALKDDPYLEDMLQAIYQRRGRPETEEG
jgi:excisionase family DNA binding protein